MKKFIFVKNFKKLSYSVERNCSSKLGNLQICIVGGGPAGFYSAQRLLRLIPNAVIDIYERLPVPFGLVRYGVAPDHLEVKNVINTFTKTAKCSQVNFYGNISLGKCITLEDLKESYHAILLTYGAEEDRKLNILGEELGNVISAKTFVGWYNGFPNDRHLNVDLNAENVVIVGQGNVAIDVARILLSPIDKLKVTDITEYSLEHLSKSKVKNISFIGRRGPLQIACTIKELREMINLPNVTTVFNKEDLIGIDKIIPSLGRPRKRLTELLYKSAMDGKTPSEGEKTFHIIFKRTPLEFKGENRVNQLLVGVNSLEGEQMESQKAVLTKKQHHIQCEMVLRSIGFKSVQAEPNIPFDFKKGIVKNVNGRISPGLYCSGWLSSGPVGVILTTMANAFETAELIYKDVTTKSLDIEHPKPGSQHILTIVRNKGIQVVNFEDWEKINREEEKRGKIKGKPREKIVSVQEMLEIAS